MRDIRGSQISRISARRAQNWTRSAFAVLNRFRRKWRWVGNCKWGKSFSSGTSSFVLPAFIFPKRCCVIATLLESLSHVFELLESWLKAVPLEILSPKTSFCFVTVRNKYSGWILILSQIPLQLSPWIGKMVKMRGLAIEHSVLGR